MHFLDVDNLNRFSENRGVIGDFAVLINDSINTRDAIYHLLPPPPPPPPPTQKKKNQSNLNTHVFRLIVRIGFFWIE